MQCCKTRPDAVAVIRGDTESASLSGRVYFYQKRDSVLVTANIQSLPHSSTGFFALHIHDGDSCSGEGFPNTDGHYDPTDAPHPCHKGDLPPLLQSCGGAYLSVRTDRFRVEDILGRTVVIHSGTDDFHTQPSGGAGTKIGCGVIRRV